MPPEQETNHDYPGKEEEARPASLTCPKCGQTSYHPKDASERYCGSCHLFLDSEATRCLIQFVADRTGAGDEEGYEYVHRYRNHSVGIIREIFGTAALQAWTKDHFPFVDWHFQYQSVPLAVVAAANWDPAERAEPYGWYRELRTGRRRPHGNPKNEFVRP